MADATYGGQGVYRERGGNRFVVATSGSADVESGGEIDVEAGGQLKISGTAFISTAAKVDLSSSRNWVKDDIFSTGTVFGNVLSSTGTGGYKPFLETATSSAAILTGYGISIVRAATAATLALAAPTAGVEKFISIITTAASVTITSSSGGADLTTAGSTQIACTTGTPQAPGWIRLFGQSSTRWLVIAQSANVTVT